MRLRSQWVALAGIVSCGGGDSADGDGALPLPERSLDAGAADVALADRTDPPAADAGVGDAKTDGPKYTGCSGAIDCERVVFTTTKEYDGTFGGIPEADQRCQTHADASQNPRVKGRKFVAWLSTTNSAASDRLVHGTKPYIRPDGATAAKSFADLADGLLSVPLSLNEDGAAPGGSNRVWTGTNPGGASGNQTCGQWKDPALKGLRGALVQTGPAWTAAAADLCSQVGHLYCIEQ